MKLLPTLMVCILFTGILNAQRTYDQLFAPQEGLIKEVEKPCRDEICLNGYWELQLMDVPEGTVFPPSPPLPGNWESTRIKIPSPVNVNSFTTGEGGDFRTFPGYPESWDDARAAWMRKYIIIPGEWSGSRFILHFEALSGNSVIYVNNHKIGENSDPFLPFSFDITPFSQAGDTVEILVWAAHNNLTNTDGKYGRQHYVAGSFWGKHIFGIWQDVYLQKFPPLYISDTYVKPLVDQGLLEMEVSLKNTTDKRIKFTLNTCVRRWINKSGSLMDNTPVPDWTLGETRLAFEEKSLSIEAHSVQSYTLKCEVKGKLDLWTPKSPGLYGLLISVNHKNNTYDRDYTRFGWRQFHIQGNTFCLNGEPIQLKGDSWHFMGVPQMTRRYAFAWYRMLQDANANAVRLHAQVYPRFYLEMADEMGICVLDETGIWSSGGGPKIDSPLLWQACEDHIKRLILRDRNNPSVFGWSVCNEMLPVARHLFNAPAPLFEKNVNEINKWIRIARKYDPTRSWISGDGETQADTDLPTLIGHYGNEEELKMWAAQEKPWGIGETGMAYYGTPAQVAKVNGAKAYESQLGRMEGLAGEAFDLISMQRNHKASYASVFNLVWYGLKPLPLGKNDLSTPPEPTEGIFFAPYQEGIPGYQPERIGPYSSTLNPGYDPTLPLYQAWPLFDAVKAAYSDRYRELPNSWKKRQDNTVSVHKTVKKENVCFLSGSDSKQLTQWEKAGISFAPFTPSIKQLILIDGENPPELPEHLVKNLMDAVKKGSMVLFWNAKPASRTSIENLTGMKITFSKRDASSFIIKHPHPLLYKLNNESLYFTEMTKNPVSSWTIQGHWVEESKIILEACHTDWRKWNYQKESVKTAKVYRNEQESKPGGIVMAGRKYGNGEIIVSTPGFFVPGKPAYIMIRKMLENTGIPPFQNNLCTQTALDSTGILRNANFYGSFKNDSRTIDLVFTYNPMSDEEFTHVHPGDISHGKYWEVIHSDDHGVFDFLQQDIKLKKYASVYLSFWMYSPRSLTNLLIEPDMPRLDLHMGFDDALSLHINGKKCREYIRTGSFTEDEFSLLGIPLEKGWNHVLIKVGQDRDQWKCKLRFSGTKPGFMNQIHTLTDL